MQLKAAIERLLTGIADDRSLEARLTELRAAEPRAAALWWWWAPRLHARNRSLFRSFIRQSHTRHLVEPGRWERWHVEPIEWQGEVAASLDPWLEVLESEGDRELFQLLYLWKRRRGGRIDARAWCADLAERFVSQPATARSRLLALYDIEADLDEDTARLLYRIDPVLARPFVLAHLPARVQWRQLSGDMVLARDEEALQALGRVQRPFAQWQAEALTLCERIPGREALLDALEQHHPALAWQGDFGQACCRLLEARGEDVLPYVRRHLSSVKRRGCREALVRLARRRGWVPLWAAVIAVCGTDREHDAAVQGVLQDWNLTAGERERRLALLSGASQEWVSEGLPAVRLHPLSTASALALWERHPRLLRQLFRDHLQPQPRDMLLPLFEEAWEAGDEDLADTLASRYLVLRQIARRGRPSPTDLVTERYVALRRDAGTLVRRAASVLTRIPAGSIPDLAELIRVNRLARLLFESSLRGFLDAPDTLSALLEAPEPHVQHLGFRALALPDPQAVTQAAARLDLLLPALLRPLPRAARLSAFAALENAAGGIAEARPIIDRARAAAMIPGRYPREALVGMIGRLLARHPSLAQDGERPVIYRRAAR